MANVIGIVGLARGEVAYYDELTRIHLTLSRPRANVFDYMNTSRLRRSVSAKTLVLVAGTLNTVTQLNETQLKKDVNIADKLVHEEKITLIQKEEVKVINEVNLEAEKQEAIEEHVEEIKEDVVEELIAEETIEDIVEVEEAVETIEEVIVAEEITEEVIEEMVEEVVEEKVEEVAEEKAAPKRNSRKKKKED